MTDFTFDPASHVYRLDGQIIPHVTEITPSDFSMVPPATLARACKRGKDSHLATQAYDEGRLDWSALPSYPEVEPRLHAWIKFLHEFEVVMEPDTIEVPTYHPTARFATTPDRGSAQANVYVRGDIALIEIKTIARMDRKVRLQTAAQAHAINYWRRRAGLPLIERRWAVQLRPNGKAYPELHEDPNDIHEFLARTLVLHCDVRDGVKKYAVSNGQIE